MGSFKFPFQDKAVKFTHVNASAAEPLFRGLFQEAVCRKKSFWGVGSPEQLAWKGFLDPRQYMPNTLIMHLV